MTTKQLLGQKCLVVLEGGCARPRRAVAGAIYVEVGKKIKFAAAALDDFDVEGCQPVHYDLLLICAAVEFADRRWKRPRRSEEHTSELQSLMRISYSVFCLKTKKHNNTLHK